MAHFYGTIHGAAKNPATQRGHSELITHNNGWHSGVTVRSRVLPDGQDIHEIYITSGSGDASGPVFIGSYYQNGGFRPAPSICGGQDHA